MMGDLIERQKALDELKYEMKYGAVIDQCGLDTSYDIIKDLPSAELEERTAKVKEGWGLAMCCACEKRVFPYDKYCSHCGARLEWE